MVLLFAAIAPTYTMTFAQETIQDLGRAEWQLRAAFFQRMPPSHRSNRAHSNALADAVLPPEYPMLDDSDS